MKELKAWLAGKILVYAQVGDIDACASFVAFDELAKRLGSQDSELTYSVGAPNREGRKILELFKFKAKEFEDVVENNFDKIVLIDTQPAQLPQQFAKLPLLVIDHHQKSGDLPKFNFWNSETASTTEIIYNLFLKTTGDIPETAAKAILFGIISDTAGLRFAKTKTLSIISSLLSEYSLEYQNVLAELAEEKDYSEKIACLKAAQRLQIKPFGQQKILVISEIGGSESTAASKLISLGADIALIVSKKPNETRIIGRARKGWNLAEIFQHASAEIKNSIAGGHPGAAVLNLPPGKEKEALSKILKTLQIS